MEELDDHTSGLEDLDDLGLDNLDTDDLDS